MVHGINQSFLNGGHRVIEEPRGFGAVFMLNDFFLNHVVLDVSQGVANLHVNRTTQDLLDDLIAAGSLWKRHDIDLCAG